MESKVYTVYNEAQQTFNFSTMYPNVIKPQGEMLLNDYNKYAMGFDLAATQPQDKVELMEETKWVVMTNFLKSSYQLKKKEEQLKLVKERVSFLKMKEKSLEAEVGCLSEKAQKKELERSKLQEELKKSQSIGPTLINKL